MDERLKRRSIVFYLFGIANVFLGLYVLIEGRSFLPPENVTWLALVFLGVGAVNFYFPRAMWQKWEQEQARLRAGRGGTK